MHPQPVPKQAAVPKPSPKAGSSPSLGDYWWSKPRLLVVKTDPRRLPKPFPVWPILASVRMHQSSGKKVVKHHYPLNRTTKSVSFDSSAEWRCDELRKLVDPRGHLQEILNLRTTRDQENVDGVSLSRESSRGSLRDRGPTLIKTPSPEGFREPLTKLAAKRPFLLTRISNARSFCSRASSTDNTHAMNRGSTAAALRPSERSRIGPPSRSAGSHDDEGGGLFLRDTLPNSRHWGFVRQRNSNPDALVPHALTCAPGACRQLLCSDTECARIQIRIVWHPPNPCRANQSI
jgi:hypothetical protein